MPRNRSVIRSYRDLDVWRRGVDLVVRCYAITRRFPDDERFGLIAQTRRASVSVPANIAEGFGRDHIGDYLRHLSFARSSLMELETDLIIAHRLDFIREDTLKQAFAETDPLGRSLTVLIRNLKRRRRG